MYRGKDQWEFYFAAAQLPDFLRGVAIHAGVDKFNADKTRDSAGCCSSYRLPRHSPKRLSEVLQPRVHSPHVPRRSCCVILKNTTGACKHHPKLVFTNTTRQTVENVFR